MRTTAWVAAALLVATACGDTADTTTTTAAPPATTVAATTTTAPPAIPPTTESGTAVTTVPPTTLATTTTTTTSTVPATGFPEGALPDLVVPDRFIDRSIGREAFDPDVEIVAESSDWYLLRLEAGSYLPVPAGWEVFNGEDSADLTFGELDEGGVEAFIQRNTEDTDVSALLEEVRSGVEDDAELFIAEMVDADNALLTGTSPDGDLLLYAVAILSHRGGALYILSAGTEAAGWADFEPVFRAMAAGWYDLAGEPLGFTLPPDLGFPPVEPRPLPDLPEGCDEIIDDALGLMQGMLDQLSDVTIEQWDEVDGDFTQLVDVEFEAAFDDLDVRTEELECDDDDIGRVFAARFDELEADGEVPELFLELLRAITLEG